MLVELNRLNRPDKGSTLIEILVAAFILAISLTALVSLTTMSIARNRLAKERVVATRLAQEGMDWVIAERNQLGYGRISSKNNDTIYCINTISSGGLETLVDGQCESFIADSVYKRELRVNAVDIDEMTYSVRVYWGSDGSGNPYEVELSGAVTRWER